MPVHIRVRDFQSVEDAEIVVDGFTAISGTNNAGKSAIIRAVSGVFSNPPGDAYTRHGAERFQVDVDFGDGHTVSWEKGPKVKPTYTIDGKGPLLPGRAVPEEALALGVRPIRAGSTEVWPQIAPQFTGQVFLLDLPGSALAEAVADVERVGRLSQALRLAEADKRNAASTLRVKSKDVERLRGAVGEFAGLDAVELVVAAVEKHLGEVTRLESEIASVRALAARVAVTRAVVRSLAGIESVQVPTAEKVADAVKVSASIRTAQQIRTKIGASRAVVSRLAGVSEIRIPSKPVEAVQVRQDLKDATARRDALIRARKIVVQVERAQQAATGIALAGVDAQIEKGRKVAAGMGWLPTMAVKIGKARTDVAANEAALLKAQQGLTTLHEQIKGLLGDLGECPVCGTPVEVHP